MLAICKSQFGAAIPENERYFGELAETNYSPVKVGELYLVCAMFFVGDRVDYLVCPDSSPLWVPSNLFDVVDCRIPSCWAFCETRKKIGYEALFDAFKIKYILGYQLLVRDYAHYVGVAEHDPYELHRFFSEKSKIETWWVEAKAEGECKGQPE